MACATILYKICRWSRLAEELTTKFYHMYSVCNIFMFIVVVVCCVVVLRPP